MKKDTHKTRVQFLYNADTDHLFAYFPDEIREHLGRLIFNSNKTFSSCWIGYAQQCESVEPDQYKDLKQELESLGYNLDIINEI